MEINQSISKEVLVRTAEFGLALAAFTGTVKTVEAQSTPTPTPTADCTSEVIIFAQYFRDNGGPTFTDGKPRFQKETDTILGPAESRGYIIEATSKRGSSILETTDSTGNAKKTFNGYADTTRNDQRAMRLVRESLDNGDKEPFDAMCGHPVQLEIMIEKSNLPVTSGPIATPVGTEIPRTPGSTESILAGRDKVRTVTALENARTAQVTHTALPIATETAVSTLSPTATSTVTPTANIPGSAENQSNQSESNDIIKKMFIVGGIVLVLSALGIGAIAVRDTIIARRREMEEEELEEEILDEEPVDWLNEDLTPVDDGPQEINPRTGESRPLGPNPR
jgi:hypothetical protein